MTQDISIMQKLKNKSRRDKITYQLVLQLFCQEEFLRRLSISRYRDNFILKGGLFLFFYSGFKSRPTMDIDFLMKRLSNNQEEMAIVMEKIIKERSRYDYVSFQLKSIVNITEQKEYHGLRIKLIGCIANTRTPFDVDIGIGDVIVPEAQYRKLSPQLQNFESPEILTYSLESSIAEKWEAMISRMETSSRMKDYYDIFYLACHYDFDGELLKEALYKTLVNRNTSFGASSIERISSMDNDREMQLRWNAFVKKSLNVELDFTEVLGIIIRFVEKPMLTIIHDEPFSEKWSALNREYNDD